MCVCVCVCVCACVCVYIPLKLEPIVQSEVRQKEKHQYNVTHICGI